MIDLLTPEEVSGAALSSAHGPAFSRVNQIIASVNGLVTGMELVRYADVSRTDDYVEDGSLARPFKSIQGALDAITDASYTKPYVLVAAPGVYNENVVMKRHVRLLGTAGFGVSRGCRIETSSGVALTVPYRDCLVEAVTVITNGATPAEAAVKVVDDGLGAGQFETFLKDFNAISTSNGRGLWVEPNALGEAVICIYAGIDGGPGAPEGIYVDGTGTGAGLIWFLGGGGGDCERGIKLVNGAFAMIGCAVGVNASETSPTAWGIEVDASTLFFLDGMISATNGLQVLNGGFAVLKNVASLGGFTGVPVDTAAGTFLGIGEAMLDGIGSAPWTGWNVLGAGIILPTGKSGQGTTGGGGPDVRPSGGLPIGFQYWATDLAPGGGPGTGSLLVWNGGAWLDMTGAVIP